MLVTGPLPAFAGDGLRADVRAALDRAGVPAAVDVEVDVVDRLDAPAGKASLFVVDPEP